MTVVITLGEVIFIGLVLFIFASLIITMIYNWIKDKFNQKYRQNCHHCVNYRQTGVSGDYLYHKCDLYNYEDKCDRNDWILGKYRKCKDFKQK